MFKVDKNKCIACMQCIKDCPACVISLKEKKANINNEGCIKCGHCIAICPVEAVSTDDYNMNEVIPYNKETFSLDAENLLNFIKFRRSIRRFKSKEVEKDKINKIIDAGRYTQTSTNSQDVSYTVVTKNINKLRDLAYESLKKKGEYILSNLTPETEHLKRYANMWLYSYEQYKKDPQNNDRLFFNAPLAIFVTSPTPINGGLASSNMELMTDALGLGTFFSGFLLIAAQDNKEILDLIGVQNSNEIISCLVIGYPDVKYKRTVPRKSPNINWI
ncbi:nitroreductase family protein [Romboutsia sp. Marseille-P6047]|uniref:nitroreductase family protein n=1 Tax=Romboutsia sp. Marseille-P6047 TaxID=2161817 RepID=UPI0008232D8D|nr:nitroreductase family protein [Romboutsia sp. Marseille-P6047]SCH07510.1 Ferredoxin II [uncultured Clostridium sp.]